MQKKWDSDNETIQRQCVEEVIARIDEIGDSPAGVIAAQEVIDIVTEHLGPEIYNRGVSDAKKLVSARLADIEIDIDALEHRP